MSGISRTIEAAVHLVSCANSDGIFKCFVQLGSIADRTIAEADSDGDGLIAFDEFVKVHLMFRFLSVYMCMFSSSFLSG